MNVEFKTYSRRPFDVDAVKVTVENIAEIAPLVGELCTKEDGTPYILVDRRIIPNVHRVYPGWWMTKMGDNVRCYSGRIFDEQFELKFPAVNRNQISFDLLPGEGLD
jgi:hypothetical protein